MIRLGYSGVHLGWGWRLAQGYSRNNEVAFNRIRHHMMRMDDGGGLYTSGPQPNTTIHHNYVSGRLHNSCGACMYRDDGSAFIVDSFNVCDMPTGASQPALLAVVRSLLCPVSTLCTLGGGLTMCCTAGGDAHRASWSAILFHVGELSCNHYITLTCQRESPPFQWQHFDGNILRRFFLSAVHEQGGSPANSSQFCSTHDLVIRNTFTNKLGVMNHTYNVVIEGTVDCTQGWTPEAVAVMRSTGYSEAQRQRKGWPAFPVPWPGHP